MQQSNSTSVWEKLLALDLVTGENPNNKTDSPWYIKLLLAISGWFGALFLVIFIGGSLGMMFGWRMENVALLPALLGAGMIFLVYKLFLEKQSDFFEHFLLALSIVGQVLVIFSLFLLFDTKSDAGIALFTVFFQAFLMWVMPHYIHRMLSSFFMILAFTYFMYAMHEPFIANIMLTFVVAWLWMHEFQWVQYKRTEAIAYGLTAALVWLNYAFLALPYADFGLYASKNTPYIDGLFVVFLLWLTLAYVVWMLLKENDKLGDNKVLLLASLATILVGLFAIKMFGLLVGIILMLIGFAHSHRLLIGLGVLKALVFLSHYYYFTGETLLDKSILLALLGIGLLVSRFTMKIFLRKEPQDV